MDTQVRRIDLSTTNDLDDFIINLCQSMSVGGYKLAGMFTFYNDLVLVFQR